MAIVNNSGTIEISGVIGINDLAVYADANPDDIERTDGVVYKLLKPVLLMTGADLTLVKGVIINLNGKNFKPEVEGSCPQLSGVEFIHNGDTSNSQGGAINQWRADHLNLKDCSIVNRSSQSTFGMELAENVTVTCSFDPSASSAGGAGNHTNAGLGMAPFFVLGGVFSGVQLYYITRLGLIGNRSANSVNRFHVKNISVESLGQFIVGYNYAPESIWEGCVFNGYTAFQVDTYQNTRENNMILLGSSIQSFFNGGTTFSRNNASNHFRCYTGGKRYLNILNGQGLTFKCRATIDGTHQTQPVVVTRNVDHLLSDDFIDVTSSSQNIEMTVLTGIWDPGGSYGDSGLVNFTNIELNAIAYGKEIYHVELTQQEAELILGSSEAYAPVVINNDASITEADKAVVDAYTEIGTPQKLYDRAMSYLTDNHNGEGATIVSRVGTIINAGSYDVDIDPNASNAFSFDGATVTIKASTFTGGIQTTGEVRLLNGALITGGDYSHVVLVSGFSGSLNFSNTNITNLENRTGVDVQVEITNSTISTLTTTSGNLEIFVIIEFVHNSTGGSFGYLNIDKYKAFKGVYASHEEAQAAIPTPEDGDYYRLSDLSAHAYRQSGWVVVGGITYIEGFTLASHLGGPGVLNNNTIRVAKDTNVRVVFDSFSKYPEIVEVLCDQSKTINLNLESNSFVNEDLIPQALPLVAKTTIDPPDSNSVITIRTPDFGSDLELAACSVELMRLSQGSIEGMLTTNSNDLAEITNVGELTLKDDRVRIVPSDIEADTGEKPHIPLVLKLENYTIDPNPKVVDKYMAFDKIVKTIVNNSTSVGVADANILQVTGSAVSGVSDFHGTSGGTESEQFFTLISD